ncbi:hypothetical protein [Gordonia hongkongensis]|uniref:hypothetical protein n=1 Tax=Gordonia hongkongensis TaxID=1701090 RepID=UPI001FF9B4D3|nr:hypothetical protein [Gordonia hongkongensis]UPG69165.1 hypothetical protein MVF96_04815 [Gordonia hongkongensis]
MTARVSAAAAVPTAVAMSDSDPIILDKTRIAPAHTEPISRVGDTRWDLAPLLHKPTIVGSRSINFDTFPPCFRAAAKSSSGSA